MASTQPGAIRVPAAEGIRTPGFDGWVHSDVGAPPYVPAGDSVWELSTEDRPDGKADRDYGKRTRDIPDAERSQTTYVAVTARRWAGAQAWARQRASEGEWADVRALAAQELATWLETRPGVHGWLAEHLGRAPWGATCLRDWFADWCEVTDPATPPGLLLAGCDTACTDLRATLRGAPSASAIRAPTRDQAVATVAAALVCDPPAADASTPGDQAPHADQQALRPEAAELEPLLERALVVHDPAAWRELVAHNEPLILISMLEDTDSGAALRRGHHVITPAFARPDEPALPRLSRERARLSTTAEY